MMEFSIVPPEKLSLDFDFASPSNSRRHPANLPTTTSGAKTPCRFEEPERHITFPVLNISATGNQQLLTRQGTFPFNHAITSRLFHIGRT
jgi:hypothetical protein